MVPDRGVGPGDPGGKLLPAAPGESADHWLLPLQAARYVADVLCMVYFAVSSRFWEGRRGRRLARGVVLQQVYFTAVQALPFTLMVALVFGALAMIQASVQLPRFGKREVEAITGLVIFRELAPIIVALLVIARSTNAIVVEIGNMRLNGELRALEILGINIDRFLVLPRLTGMIISVPLLTVIFCAAALWGGFWVAKFSGFLESNFVLSRLSSSLDATLWWNVMVRAFFFALVISSVSCHHGLRVKVSATEVPQQATRAVISSLSLCFLGNLVLSLAVL